MALQNLPFLPKDSEGHTCRVGVGVGVGVDVVPYSCPTPKSKVHACQPGQLTNQSPSK